MGTLGAHSRRASFVGGVEQAMSPYVRMITVTLADEEGTVDACDRYFQQDIINSAAAQPGFRGAQRLLGVGDSDGAYVFATYWSSAGTLRASSPGSEYWDNIAGEKSAATGGVATGVRRYVKPGTDLAVRMFEHLQYEKVRMPSPFLEEGSEGSAIFQLACISLGVGIFAIPSVYQSVGIILGCVILVGFAIFSDLAMQMMLHCANVTGADSYEGALSGAFGGVGRMPGLFAIAVSTWTANCAHMKFVSGMFVSLEGGPDHPGGGFLQTIVGSEIPHQEFAALLLFGLAVLPLCFKRHLSELRLVSLIVVLFCIFVSSAVVLKCLLLIGRDGTHNTQLIGQDLREGNGVSVLLEKVPVAGFGFSIVAELFSVRAEAKDPRKLGRCVHIATVIVVIVYLFVGMVGMLAFEKLGDSILDSFDDQFMSALKLGLCVVITLLYPLINFPTVYAIDALIAGEGGAPSLRRKRVASVLVWMSVLALDTLVKDLGLVFGLAGSLGLGLLAYVLPAAGSLGTLRHIPVGMRVSVPATMATIVVLVMGLVMTIGSTVRIVYSAAR